MKPTVLFFLLFLSCTVWGQTKLAENTNLYGFVVNGKPLMLDSVGSLWTTDGTPAGTKVYTTKVRMNVSDTSRSGDGTLLGTKIYFAGKAASSGVELWSTDGTDAGTSLVKEITPGPNSTPMGDFAVVNNKVCFGANDGVHGYELWISDGTAGGTKLLKDLTGNANSAGLDGLGSGVPLASNLYFFADDGTHGYELWKTDGTEAGTKLVKDIDAGVDGQASDFSIEVIGNYLYFFADDGVHGTQLWRSDGTEGGTAMVKNITLSNQSTLPNPQMLVFNSKLYFTAKKGMTNELWVSDGTANGTTLVKSFPADMFSNSFGLSGAVIFAGKFLFTYTYLDNTFQFKSEIWTSDGTTNNTTKIFTAPPSSIIIVSLKYDQIYNDPNHTPPFSGKVFFTTIDGSTQASKLWITDGTTAGTTTVFNNPFPGFFGNTLYGATSFYFWDSHSTSADSISLYKTDGTTSGTKVVQSFPKPVQDVSSTYPSITFEYNGEVYYCAYDKKDNSNVNDFFRSGSGGSVTPGTTYTFTGNGSWDNAANWQNNQIPPANLSSGEIIIDPVPGGECLITGGKTLAPGVKLTIKSNKKLRVTN